MELFYSQDITDGIIRLSDDEAAHCVRVLRHRVGDRVSVMDGRGNLYQATLLEASARTALARIDAVERHWGGHPYRLSLACCPTKNNDRYEWMIEKATEIGVDVIIPLIGEHSERKIYKTERARRIALSASKQSLKARIPEIREPVSVLDYLRSFPEGDEATEGPLKLIAYCFEGEQPRQSISAVMQAFPGREVVVLIGPEGDFSPQEAAFAQRRHFIPIHLGNSRLRTETAALTAVTAVYLRYMDQP